MPFCLVSSTMARHFFLAFALLAALAQPSIAADDLVAARKLLLRGKYDEAADAYRALAKKKPVEAALGVARARQAVGDREGAEKALRDALAKHADDADLHSELALQLFEQGQLEEAEKSAAQAIKLESNQVAARWLTAELLQARGKLQEAEAAYEWLVDYQNEADELSADDILYVGRGAAQFARWRRNSGQFRLLVNDFYPQALESDEDCWMAHLETALLFLEKYNESEATNELSAGIAINPNAAELHVVRAALALQKFDVKTAGTALERALTINPKLVSAHQLKADLLIADQRAADALEVLEAARKLNPVDEETLGRIAACCLVVDGAKAEDKDSRASKLTAEVLQRNEHCGRYFATMADTFDLMRKYPQASHYYREAQERMPQLAYLRGRHGLVQMRLGEEVEAAKLLEESFEEDPFNVRVKNMLEVLDVLQGYAVLETDHFVIKFDRGRDELLAKYMARYLEDEVYPEIVVTLGYRPEGKSLFEVFNRAKNTRGHSWFSARMVGLPFIGTVGACGGKIVAVASPNDMPQKFHWGRVLKHEFVHVVNLQQTDFNIPHWFTEGIAVRLEQLPRPAQWNEILAKRMAEDKLFDLSDINYGFIRPANQEDWTLAYCQAELYCDYLVKTYGGDALAKLLKAYRENLTTEAALEREFGVKIADVEKSYRAFLTDQLREAGHPVAAAKEAQMSLADLEKAVTKKPADASLQAQLALSLLTTGNTAAARKAALESQKLEAKQPLAGFVLARIQSSIGDNDAARTLLLAVHNADAPNERVVALLAALELEAENFAVAEGYYRLGLTHFGPRDKWLKPLAKLYLKSGQEKELAGVLEELAAVDYDNATLRKKLAQLAIAREDWTAAEHWAKDALFIDLGDAALHAQLAEARVNQKKHSGAIEEYAAAIELKPDVPAWRLALATAHLANGQTKEAREVLEKLIELDPKFPGAKLLLEQLEK
jgi:tetratricopeptide (TPR) repeat protein